MSINLYDCIHDRRTGDLVGYVADTYDERRFTEMGYTLVQTAYTIGEVFDCMGGAPSDMLMTNYGDVYAVCLNEHTVPVTMTQDCIIHALPFHHDEWR